VFFGRFIALLRIFAGPLAGSLRMPYVRFLAANASGGIVWATGITYLIWFLGAAAERWLSRASWIGLVAAVLVGLLITLLIRRKTRTLAREAEARAEAPAANGQPRAEPDRVAGRRPGAEGGN
jgi:membrane protein DedA with SNARE-associated domain